MSYKDRFTNATVCNKIQPVIGPYKTEKRNYDGSEMWSDQVVSVRISYMAKLREKKRGRQTKRWEDMLREWTSLDFNSCH